MYTSMSFLSPSLARSGAENNVSRDMEAFKVPSFSFHILGTGEIKDSLVYSSNVRELSAPLSLRCVASIRP
jgi:hypothetical protein